MSTPLGLWSAESAGLIAWKNGIASRASRSGPALTSSIVSLSPSTMTPDIVLAFPSNTSCAPTTSARNAWAGDCSVGLASRLSASAKLCAVTGWPVLKR